MIILSTIDGEGYMSEKHYANFDVVIHLGNLKLENAGMLVSEYGIWKLLTHKNHPVQYGDLTGKIVEVEFQSMRLRGRLTREESVDGTN